MKFDIDGCISPGRVCSLLLLFVLVGSCSSCAKANSSPGVCELDDSAIATFEVVREWSPFIQFRRAKVQGSSNVVAVSSPRTLDFPQPNSQLRFYYVDFQENPDGGPGVVGCLRYVDAQGRSHTIRREFHGEGGQPPVIVTLFTARLDKGLGNTLFLVLRWASKHANIGTEGYLYQTKAFGASSESTEEPAAGWHELVDLERDIDNFGGFDGVRGGKKVTYPYKDKGSILRRLRELGNVK